MDPSDTPPNRTRQPLWPLFLIAAFGLAFGYYFVLFDAPADAAGAVTPNQKLLPAPKTLEPDPLELAEIDLKFGPTPARHHLEVHQTATRGDSEGLSTTISATVIDAVHEPQADEANPAKSGELAIDRTYSDTAIQIMQAGKAVGPGITTEVERLIDITSHRVVLTPHGKVVRYDLTSADSRQLQQTLDLIRDALRVVTPTFSGEPVNVGETWSYELPMPKLGEAEGLQVEGTLRFDASYKGIVERGGKKLAVVELVLRASAKGEFPRPEHAPVKYDLRASGNGRIEFDFNRGVVADTRTSIRQTTTLSVGEVAEKFETETSIAFVELESK